MLPGLRQHRAMVLTANRRTPKRESKPPAKYTVYEDRGTLQAPGLQFMVRRFTRLDPELFAGDIYEGSDLFMVRMALFTQLFEKGCQVTLCPLED